jgi:hypothetical protein
MGPAEVLGRAGDHARQLTWAPRQQRPGQPVAVPAGLRDVRDLATPVPYDARGSVPEEARRAVLHAADDLVRGEWTVFGELRTDLRDPDWFLDPASGRRAPQAQLAWRIDHRDESATGNVKSVWELSRHHHLTVLAAAWWLTGDETYAELVDAHLRSWWRENPFLSGVHWTSGIELGIRLTSWVWVRRLLHDWPKVGDLFEANPEALQQIWCHQHYLAAFPSRGSSRNNHAVAEDSGLLTAACAFPWFGETDRWRELASRRLVRDLAANTFESGVNRELATDYHRFVTELGLLAAVEAGASGHDVGDPTWTVLVRSLDAAAAMLDVRGNPPRQGDGDEGRAVLLDGPDVDPWSLLLGMGGTVVGARPWWPATHGSVAATLLAALAPSSRRVAGRPETRPARFEDAGIHLLRSRPEDGPEIWCRCDGGPHGFLSIAAHAHADALSVEVRHDGSEVLVDPGTYCYHGEPEWRSYFRSTLAHNTIEIDGQSSSEPGGPFLWTTHADTAPVPTPPSDAAVQWWSARQRGYVRLDASLRHRRTVRLDSRARELVIEDVVTSRGHHVLRLALHLGPDVEVEDVEGEPRVLELQWPSGQGVAHAELHLPARLEWSRHRGEQDPPLGWYSPRFAERVPTTAIIGSAAIDSSVTLRTRLVFLDGGGSGSRG